MPRRSPRASGPTSSAPSVNPGDRAVRFLNNLTHTGDFSGQPFELRPWQADPIRRLFGTFRPDGTRQYRKTFWALPRKQGKTEIVAGASLYLLMGQGRENQRIYTASGDVEQAGLIFGAARDMIRNDPELADRTVVYEGYKRIDYPAGNSSLKVLSSVPKSKHGLGPTAVLIDEFHVVQDELVKVLTSGFGARKDPLTWMITTAGWDQTSLCFDEWQYALKVRNGEIEDPTYLPVIFAADPTDDWTDEATWFKAMPALGDFCSLEFIREEFKSARERPRFENGFKQLYLNLWTEQARRWLQGERWAECGTLDPETLEGRDCYAGIDLGVTGDMSALALVFPNELGGVDVLMRYWVPREGKWRLEERNRDIYPLWEREGWLTYTNTASTDFDQVEREVLEMNERYPFRILLGDRAYAKMFLHRLYNNAGLRVAELTQGPIMLNEPMVKLESMVLDGTIRHDGHPVLAWNVANAAVHVGNTGLMYLDKSRSTGRIDGLAAIVDALRAFVDDPSGGASDQSPLSVIESG